MGVSKVYTCDLCGLEHDRLQLMRLGVRDADDRPEDADWVYVGPCCHERPVIDVIKAGAELRQQVADG